jgi:hypothetical protein
MRTGACVWGYLSFLGTLELFKNTKVKERLSGSKTGSTAVPSLEPWNCADALARQVTEIATHPIKIWGGYVATTSAPSASADQGLDTGGACAKFQGRNALGLVVDGLDLGDRAGRPAEGRNGGFPPFSVVAIGRVGTAVLECAANVEADQGFADDRAQPAGLDGAASAGLGGRGVVDADRQGVAPPSGPRFSPSSKA